MEIRKASSSDGAVLARIIRESFRSVADQFCLTPENAPSHPSNCTPDWIATAMDKGVWYFILEDEGVPRGCVAMENAGPDFCYLERLAVLPEHRHGGFGKALVAHVLQEARALGLSRIDIAIIAEHTVLREWYELLGFRVTGMRTFERLPFGVMFMTLPLTG